MGVCGRYSTPHSGNLHRIYQELIFQGVWSIVAVILTHFIFGGFTRPILLVAFIHAITFAFDLAVFIVALTFTPYTFCDDSEAKGCEMVKAAVGIDGALW
jgi:hypothetical protein